MGYRSEVYVCLKKEDLERLKAKVNEVESLDYLLNMAEEKEVNEEVTVIYWDWVKWYDTFPEVAAVEKFLNTLDEESKPYKFIRIGEDIEDNEFFENYCEGECDHLDFYRDVNIV